MAELAIWKGLGIEQAANLDNILPAAFEHWWVDPRGKEMGSAATYFKYDVAEAKKLLAAAGLDKGLAIDFHFTPEFLSADYRKTSLIVSNMLKEGGVNLTVVPDDYNTVWQPKTQRGESTGLLFSVAGQYYDPTLYLNYFFAPDGTRNHMLVNDPVYNDLMDKQRVTLDARQRHSILLEVQKHMATEMRYSPVTFQLAPIIFAYPHVRNVNAYRSPASSYGVHLESTAYYWLDK
jgi:ABC-type transport system substrate-binding protein